MWSKLIGECSYGCGQVRMCHGAERMHSQWGSDSVERPDMDVLAFSFSGGYEPVMWDRLDLMYEWGCWKY